jgi:hypothetical protein
MLPLSVNRPALYSDFVIAISAEHRSHNDVVDFPKNSPDPEAQSSGEIASLHANYLMATRR